MLYFIIIIIMIIIIIGGNSNRFHNGNNTEEHMNRNIKILILLEENRFFYLFNLLSPDTQSNVCYYGLLCTNCPPYWSSQISAATLELICEHKLTASANITIHMYEYLQETSADDFAKLT